MSDTLEQVIRQAAEEYCNRQRCAMMTPNDKSWHRTKAAYIEAAKWMHEQSKARESVLLKALNKIGLGESQFDNVDHMYTARQALEEYKKLGGG